MSETRSARHLSLSSTSPHGTPYDGICGEALPESDIFFRSQVYARVGFSLFEIYKRVRNSVIWVCERAQGLKDERSIFVIDSYLQDNPFTEVKGEASFKQGM